MFCVRRTVSACGDRCSLCGEWFSPAETRFPCADDRFRLVFRACRDRCSTCGGHAELGRPLFCVRRTRSPHAETRARMLRKLELHCRIGTTCYGTPRRLLLPTDPWVITGYICTVHMRVVLGPKTSKRSLAWRPSTRHGFKCASIRMCDPEFSRWMLSG